MAALIPSASATGSGTMTLAGPSTNSNQTITIPDATGTMMLNGPTFSAYNNAQQTVSSSTYTKVNLQLEEFDTANCFDNATNYRFTPTVSGYYQVNGQISYSFTVVTRSIVVIYKNGASFKFGTDGANTQNSVSALIYMNGSTDYIELYGWISGTGTLQFDNGTAKATYFQASMVRGA